MSTAMGRYLEQAGDFRLSTALRYLDHVVQKHDELDALYWEGSAHDSDPIVEDAKQFLQGVPRPQEPARLGPRARLVERKKTLEQLRKKICRT